MKTEPFSCAILKFHSYFVLITLRYHSYVQSLNISWLYCTCTFIDTVFSIEGVLDLDIHLQPLKKAVLEVAYEWKNIGRSLPGVTEGNIRSIRFREDNECLNEVLSKWIATGNAKTTDLLTALEDPPVSRTDIANKIRALEGEERANVGL